MLNPKLSDSLAITFELAARQTGVAAALLPALGQVYPASADGVPTYGLGAAATGLDESDRILAAARAVRSLIEAAIAQGWSAARLWDAAGDRYATPFLEHLASGRMGLAACSAPALISAYQTSLRAAVPLWTTPQVSFSTASPSPIALDAALLQAVERVGQFYRSLTHQREALIECLRVWRGLTGRAEAIDALGLEPATVDDATLDRALLTFASRLSTHYGGFPQQREALLRLVQLWRQLDTRPATIAALSNDPSLAPTESTVDLALLEFAQRAETFYTGTGNQRNGVAEAVRLWRQLETRNAAIASLGVDPALASVGNAAALAKLDQEMRVFLDRVPAAYRRQVHEREALVRLVQLWRGLGDRAATFTSLQQDLQTLPWIIGLVIAPTVLKTRPVQSAELPSAEKLNVPKGELALLRAIDDGSHYRVTLVEPLGNRRDWYIFKNHLDFLELAELEVKLSTVYKSKPEQAANLPEPEKLVVNPPRVDRLRSYEDLGNHLRFRPVKLVGNRAEWYVFEEHIALKPKAYAAPKEPPAPVPSPVPQPAPVPQPSPAPVPSPVPQPTPVPAPVPQPVPDRGRQIQIPGIGLVWTEDPILPKGNFSWGEATKGGTRIPLNSTISRNIVAMARRMEEVRTRLGNRTITVTSWYRPPAVNAAVGGARNSTHLQGHGVDFNASGLSARAVQQILDAWWPGGLGYGPNFTHLDNRGYRARWNYSN